MAEVTIHPGHAVHRPLVRLRVAMTEAERAAELMQLPAEPLRWSGSDPAALWVSPDQWLLVGESGSPGQLIQRCEDRLGGILHNATDATDALTCIAVEGAGARGLLAMLSGIDFHASRFRPGQCARTRMAKVAVLVRSVEGHRFELFVDRSVGAYLELWLRRSAQDPIHAASGPP